MNSVINVYSDSSLLNDFNHSINCFLNNCTSDFYQNLEKYFDNISIKNFDSNTAKINIAVIGNDFIYKNKFKILSEYSNYEDYDQLISFLNEKCNDTNFWDFIIWSMDKLKEYQKLNLILSILTSDANIFTIEFKNILIDCKNSKYIVLSSRAEDILNLYKKQFEDIKCM